MRRQLRQQLYAAAGGIFSIKSVDFLLKNSAQKSHLLNLENREKLSLTGVVDVSGFDENVIVLVTGLGPLTIRGEALHIDRIDLAAGQLEVRGRVRELSYEEAAPEGGFWSRLFG